MATVTIVGSGMMGSALAFPARENGHEVRLVGTHLDREIIDTCKKTDRHPKFTKDFPAGIKYYQIEELREALDAAIADDASEASHLSIDISGVPYIDSTGIGVLVGTVHRAADRDMSVSVMRPQRNVARVLSLLGLDAELNVSDAQE